MTTEPPEKKAWPPGTARTDGTGQRDWLGLGLLIAILYLALFLPFATLLGAKTEVLGGAIGVLATTLGGIVAVRAVRK